MESRARTSLEQFSTLLEFMERHGDLTKPQTGPQGRVRAERLWQELANVLNAIGGGASKTAIQWKKVWADWKSKTKKKALIIRQYARGTGGGPSSRQRLTVFEERVLAIMGPLAVEGQAEIEEIGLPLLLPPSEPPPPAVEDIATIEIEVLNTDRLDSQQINASPPAPVIPVTPPRPRRIALEQRSTAPSTQHHSAGMSRATTPSRSQRRPATPSTPRSAAAVSSPQRLHARERRRRAQTPFDRATSEFVTVERRRLELEELRERNFHERESRRLDVDAQHNELLSSLLDIARAWLGQRNRDATT